MPKIVAISDTHLHNLDFILNGYEGDILIHSGDALIRGDLHEAEMFMHDWEIVCKRFKHSIFVPGNHDIHIGKYQFYFKEQFKKLGSHFLMNEGLSLENLKFWGHSYIPEINGHWFGESTDQERREVLKQLPGIDVMISHGPPLGILDASRLKNGGLSRNYGCGPLREWIYDKTPKLVVCGHIHTGRTVDANPYFMKTLRGESQIVNASICDEGYKPVFPPVVINI